MRGAVTPLHLLPQYAFMAWCSVKKHRDNFIFTFYVKQMDVVYQIYTAQGIGIYKSVS